MNTPEGLLPLFIAVYFGTKSEYFITIMVQIVKRNVRMTAKPCRRPYSFEIYLQIFKLEFNSR